MENIKEKKKLISPEAMQELMESLYGQILRGIPKVSNPVEQLASDYLSKSNGDIKKAASSMIKYQIAKCGTSGFLTSFGGFLTMPVTIPADLSSTLYVQMRMAAALAALSGYDLDCDQTRTFVYATVAGVSVSSILKSCGIQFTTKVTKQMINKISGKTLKKINEKFGFRLITKFGTKGIINLGKAIPVVGGVVGASFNMVETKFISNRAYKLFIEGEDYSDKGVVDLDDIKDNDDVIDAEVVEEDGRE